MAPRITSVDKSVADALRKSFPDNFFSSFINVDGYLQPDRYADFAEAIDEFEVRDDDVWVCSFPKSGTTWTQEMVWCIANDLDFERAKVPLADRFPSIDSSTRYPKMETTPEKPVIKLPQRIIDSVGYVAEKPSPRFIKSHLPTESMPRQLRNGDKKPKIIYVTRNPKDTCISLYHLYVLLYGFDGGFDKFCNLFLENALILGPYWKHVLGFWNQRHDYNMLFLKYEDMKKDLPSVIEQTATFFGKTLTTDQVSSLSKHLSFSRMKDNPAVNLQDRITEAHKILRVKREGEFMRRGTSGQWKTEMTPEMTKRFDDWIEANLKGTGREL